VRIAPAWLRVTFVLADSLDRLRSTFILAVPPAWLRVTFVLADSLDRLR
jgi:hypothetical protein